MKGIYIIIATFFFALPLLSQSVGINSDGSPPHASAILHVKSINQGILTPRLNTIQRESIASPAVGLLVFDLDTQSFWFKGTSDWIEIADTGIVDHLHDADDDTGIHSEENPDDDIIRFKTGGQHLVLETMVPKLHERPH